MLIIKSGNYNICFNTTIFISLIDNKTSLKIPNKGKQKGIQKNGKKKGKQKGIQKNGKKKG